MPIGICGTDEVTQTSADVLMYSTDAHGIHREPPFPEIHMRQTIIQNKNINSHIPYKNIVPNPTDAPLVTTSSWLRPRNTPEIVTRVPPLATPICGHTERIWGGWSTANTTKCKLTIRDNDVWYFLQQQVLTHTKCNQWHHRHKRNRGKKWFVELKTIRSQTPSIAVQWSGQ